MGQNNMGQKSGRLSVVNRRQTHIECRKSSVRSFAPRIIDVGLNDGKTRRPSPQPPRGCLTRRWAGSDAQSRATGGAELASSSRENHNWLPQCESGRTRVPKVESTTPHKSTYVVFSSLHTRARVKRGGVSLPCSMRTGTVLVWRSIGCLCVRSFHSLKPSHLPSNGYWALF